MIGTVGARPRMPVPRRSVASVGDGEDVGHAQPGPQLESDPWAGVGVRAHGSRWIQTVALFQSG